MNILFLDSIECQTYGGMEEWIRLVSVGLASRGHSVTVAGRRDSDFLKRTRNPIENLSILELEISGDFNPFTINRLKDEIRERETDVVVANFNKDLRIGGLAAWLAGNTQVVWSVGLNITKDNLVHRVLTPKLLDRVVVPSHSLKEQITRHGYVNKELVDVVPIGIEDRLIRRDGNSRKRLRGKYKLPVDCRVALTVGRLVTQKGHVHLVEAIPRILERCMDFFFVFAGDGPLEESLRRQAEGLGIEKHVLFGGMIEDLACEWSGADVMIHPSIEEPFGIAVLEGMRAGLPIVASDVGGIPEVVGQDEAAILVSPGQPYEIASAVVSLMSSTQAMSEYGERGRARYVRLFAVDRMCDRLEKVLLSVIEAGQTS